MASSHASSPTSSPPPSVRPTSTSASASTLPPVTPPSASAATSTAAVAAATAAAAAAAVGSIAATINRMNPQQQQRTSPPSPAPVARPQQPLGFLSSSSSSSSWSPSPTHNVPARPHGSPFLVARSHNRQRHGGHGDPLFQDQPLLHHHPYHHSNEQNGLLHHHQPQQHQRSSTAASDPLPDEGYDDRQPPLAPTATVSTPGAQSASTKTVVTPPGAALLPSATRPTSAQWLTAVSSADRPDVPPELWSDEQKGEYAFQLLLTVSPSVLASVAHRLQPLLRRDFIALLPHELAVAVLAHAAPDRRTLARCARVSRAWRAVADDNAVWRAAYVAQGWYINLRVLSTAAAAAAAAAASGEATQPLHAKPQAAAASLAEATADWKRIYRDRLTIEENWRLGRYSVREIVAHPEAVYCVQFDEDKIVSGSRDHTVKVFDMATGTCRVTLRGHSASVLCLQYDEQQLITGSSDSTLIIWDLAAALAPTASGGSSGSSQQQQQPHLVQRRLRGHTDAVLNLRFDAERVVSCSKDRTVRVWERQTGETLAVLAAHRAAVNAVHFDDRLLVSASGDRFVKVWAWNRGRSSASVVRTLAGHSRGIACVQFDGTTVVSGSSDCTIRLWNATTGAPLRTLAGHSDLVRTLQFDATRVVSGSYDRSVKVWDRRSGRLLLDLVGPVPAVAAPAGGDMAAAAAGGGGGGAAAAVQPPVLHAAHASRIFKLQFNDARIVSCSQDQ
ncbi:hypothetical protein HK405_009997, partial [Cladochytrium tenue]